MSVPGRRFGRALRVAVALFSLLCLGWVLCPIITNARDLATRVDGLHMACWAAGGAVVYTVLSGFLALAWWWLAGVYGDRPSWRQGYAVFARSQLAKYLPGNAFHYVSRQALGRRAGLSHPALVASGFLELGSLLAASALLALLAAGRLAVAEHTALAWGWAAFGAFAFLAGWPMLDSALRRLRPTACWLKDLPHLGFSDTLRLFGPSLLCHTVFFVGTGFVLLALIGAAAPAATLGSPWQIVGFYPLAWMAGTVTLGAPAGVGVREAVLTLQLSTLLTPAQAATAALALRLVTLMGDLLTALVGWWLHRTAQES